METQKIRSGLKKTVIISLPVIFALVAALAIAFMVGGNRRDAYDDPAQIEGEGGTESGDVQVVAPAETDGGEQYSSGLAYMPTAEGCEVVGMGSCTDRNIIIPSVSPDGDRVTSIGDRAFAGVSVIGEVVLPDSLLTVGKNAFKGSGITSIEIGGSVLEIGEGAFAECLSLSSINVSPANALYSSEGGVLFDRDMSTLLCYPSGRSGSTYELPSSVKKIGPMALTDGVKLKEISYGGSREDWKDIYISVGNSALDSLKITFAPEEK